MRFEDQVVIVTGAGSGIGEATAHRFADEGARVVLVDIDEEAIARVERSINDDECPGSSLAITTDVSDAAQVQSMAADVSSRLGRVDVLVNNAGLEFPGRVTDVEPDDWDRITAVNLRSVYLCSKFLIPIIGSSGGGSIVNTASQLGTVGYPNFAVYNATKGGVVNLTRNLALDYAEDNIRVNAVCPGPIDTPHIERQAELLPEGQREGMYRDIAALVPLGRLGQPDEIAKCITFLASDDASFMTGSLLVVDGGYTAI